MFEEGLNRAVIHAAKVIEDHHAATNFFRELLIFIGDLFKEPFLSWQASVGAGELNVHALIVLVGGAFIVYTAVKELTHMLSVHDLGKEGDGAPQRSVKSAIGMIVVMNLVFSFDSILSAIALTDVFLVMAAAIIISGVMMIVLADHVARFLEKNRLFEVLGLFILFLVGVMLLSEGGHLAHLSFFGHAIEPMAKSTFYFTLIVLVIVDVAQGRYQKKLLLERQREATA